MRSLPFLLCITLLCLSGSIRAEELNVSAAASLADVLKEIDAGFEKETGIKVRLNLGASSLLARQIEEGAPADVFFSADLAKMDGLEKKGLIQTKTKQELLTNTLVVVAPADSALKIGSMRDLTNSAFKHIATGDPEAVPVGVYAREHLQSLGVWGEVRGKIVSMSNVRAALAAVEAGNVEAGIVYKTDAAVSSKVRVIHEVPAADGPKIVYPAAITKAVKNPEGARKYLKYLNTPAAGKAFRKFGFGVLSKTRETVPAPR